MSIGSLIQAWRISRGYSLEDLASASQVAPHMTEKIEAGEIDPSASMLESFATALKVPVAWLFTHPTTFQHLFHDPDDEATDKPAGPDPVTERILSASRMDQSLYVLLTALMQSGEPKLLHAAEMSLRSLVKQANQSTVPWQNRPSGHFEPPSD